jgi:hypothetical protein
VSGAVLAQEWGVWAAGVGGVGGVGTGAGVGKGSGVAGTGVGTGHWSRLQRCRGLARQREPLRTEAYFQKMPAGPGPDRQPTRAIWRSAARWRRWRGSEFYACNAKIGFGGDLMVPLLSDRAAALWAPRPAPLNLRRFGSPGRIRTSDQPVNRLWMHWAAHGCEAVHKISY